MEKISNNVIGNSGISERYSSNGERLKYVDVMRGLTMILVVYTHIAGLTFGIHNTTGTPLSSIMHSLRMPLFFFISGFIAYKSAAFWDGKNYLNRLLNKARVQLVPTFVFFGIFYIFIEQVIFPYGYWFTLALFLCFLIYFTISFLLHKTNDNIILVSMALIAVLLVVFRSRILAFLPYSKYYCINEISTYLGFFV